MLGRVKTLTSALVLIFSIAGSAGANDYPYPGGVLDSAQHAYQHGYRDGFHRGRQDRSRNVAYDYKNDDWKNGDPLYEKYLGDKKAFKQGYREAYQAGYDDGYKGRPGRLRELYGIGSSDSKADQNADIYLSHGYGYSDVAFDIGYRDGLADGQADKAKNKDSVSGDHEAYRRSDHGYLEGYGAKEIYQQRYRQGYILGYQDGYDRWTGSE